MKKLLIFLSTFVFVLLIPNLKVSALTGLQNNFTSTNIPWGTDTVKTVNFDSRYSPTFNNFDGFASFNIMITNSAGSLSACDIPNDVWLVTTSSYASICTLSSASLSADSVNNYSDSFVLFSVSCPISQNGSKPSYIRLKRSCSSNNSGTILLSTGAMFYTDSSSSTTSAVNGVNDSINNDTVSPNTENSSTAQGWASNNASDSVVSDMVLMPITLLNAFSSGFSGSCQAYNLGSLYGTNLTLPCINLQNYLGATLWGIIDVLMSGFLIYGIGKKFVRVFNDFTNLKDSQVDELYGGGN